MGCSSRGRLGKEIGSDDRPPLSMSGQYGQAIKKSIECWNMYLEQVSGGNVGTSRHGQGNLIMQRRTQQF